MPQISPRHLTRFIFLLTLTLVVPGVSAQAPTSDAYLIAEGRLGNLVSLDETLEGVTGRLGEANQAPFSFPGYKVYSVLSTPPLLIAVCDSTGRVFHAEMQQKTAEALQFVTPEGISLASSEAEVLGAYGPPDETRDLSDGVLHLYPERGLVFIFSNASGEMQVLGIYQGSYMSCE